MMHGSNRSSLIKLSIGLVASLFLMYGCNDAVSSSKLSRQDLINAFDSLYLAAHGKEYPYTEEHLQTCRKQQEKPCLTAFNQVDQARTLLGLHRSKENLGLILDIIEEKCTSNVIDDNIVCHGGIMALYFYDSVELDSLILNRVSKFPAEVLGKIFNAEFAWYHNRPNNQKWINFIQTADINWHSAPEKQYIIELFGKKLEQLDRKPGLIVGLRL